MRIDQSSSLRVDQMKNEKQIFGFTFYLSGIVYSVFLVGFFRVAGEPEWSSHETRGEKPASLKLIIMVLSFRQYYVMLRLYCYLFLFEYLTAFNIIFKVKICYLNEI